MIYKKQIVFQLKKTLSKLGFLNKIYRIFNLKNSSGEQFSFYAFSKNTELVLEGYPRSGNTWLRNAILFKKKDIIISSHIHYPCSIRFAVKRNIPCIILLRNPLDSISSLMIRDKTYDVKTAIDYYIFFYENSIYYKKNNVILLDFKLVVSDLNLCFKILNDNFNLNLSFFSKKNLDDFKSFLENSEKSKYSKEEQKYVIGLPDSNRTKLKKNVSSEILKNKNFEKANKLFLKLYEKYCIKDNKL
jgi:hypothetical protein